MTYFGGEKCVPGYNVMGVCKAALDSIVKYLAFDLGPRGIRVNALSAGPLRTWPAAARASTTCWGCTKRWRRWAATSRTKKWAAPARSCCPSMSDGITGEILHVDGGYNAMGSPGRLLEGYKATAT